MSIARNSAIDAICKVGTIALSFISGIFVSRLLGPEGRGAFILATALAMTILTTLGSFGLRAGCQVFAAKEPGRIGELHGLTVILCALVGLSMSCGLALFPHSVANYLLPGIERTHLMIVAGAFPMLLYHLGWAGLMNGSGAVAQRSLVELGYNVTQSLTLIGLLIVTRGENLFLLIAAFYGWAVVACAAMYLSLRKRIPSDRPLWCLPRRDLVRYFFGYSKWIYVSDLASNGRNQVDQWLVNFIGGQAIFGLYNQASSLARRPLLLSQSLSTAAYQSITASDRAEAGRLTASGARQMVILWAGIAGAGLLCSPLIPFIYGPDFAPSVWPFQVLVVSIAALGVSRMVAVFYNGHLKNPVLPLIFDWIAFGFQIGLSIVLSRMMGPLLGISLGTALAMWLLIAMFVTAFAIRKDTPPLRDLLIPRREDFRAWRRFLPARWRQPPPPPPTGGGTTRTTFPIE
ncbi:MAG: oligosaccharide flippase family protein [Sumerlaeia bacterium]